MPLELSPSVGVGQVPWVPALLILPPPASPPPLLRKAFIYTLSVAKVLLSLWAVLGGDENQDVPASSTWHAPRASAPLQFGIGRWWGQAVLPHSKPTCVTQGAGLTGAQDPLPAVGTYDH